jgi:hypothetical protein
MISDYCIQNAIVRYHWIEENAIVRYHWIEETAIVRYHWIEETAIVRYHWIEENAIVRYHSRDHSDTMLPIRVVYLRYQSGVEGGAIMSCGRWYQRQLRGQASLTLSHHFVFHYPSL